MKNFRQQGMTLTETLISLAIGMVVISGIVSIYTSTIQSSGETLKAAKLNQELATLISVMGNDIRRAGYNASTSVFSTPQGNLFSQPSNTALVVFDAYTDGSPQGATGSGSCILFAYDTNADGAVDTNDVVGFRLKDNVVEMRRSGETGNATDTCNDSANDTWSALTNGNVVSVTSLEFDLSGSKCLRTDEPNDVDDDGANGVDDNGEYDCYTRTPGGGSGISTVETRQVKISVRGELVTDSSVYLSLEDTVRVRNDYVRVY